MDTHPPEGAVQMDGLFADADRDRVHAARKGLCVSEPLSGAGSAGGPPGVVHADRPGMPRLRTRDGNSFASRGFLMTVKIEVAGGSRGSRLRLSRGYRQKDRVALR